MGERRVKNNIDVLGGEGDDEVEFFSFLCSIYLADSVILKIRNGHGGSPKQAVDVALGNLPQLNAYRRKMMVFDGDRTDEAVQSGIDECDRLGIRYIISKNRFEAEIGRILGCDLRTMKKLLDVNGEVAKQEFDRICPPGERRYHKLLPKEVLEKQRKHSGWLGEIIGFIENSHYE